jgi:hypothetical protein
MITDFIFGIVTGVVLSAVGVGVIVFGLHRSGWIENLDKNINEGS